MIPIAGVPSGAATALAWVQEAQETSPEAGQLGAQVIPEKWLAAAPFVGEPHDPRATPPWRAGAGHGIGQRPPALISGVVQKVAAAPAHPPRRGVNGVLPGGRRGSAGP
jgi:hypothetical protein